MSLFAPFSEWPVFRPERRSGWQISDSATIHPCGTLKFLAAPLPQAPFPFADDEGTEGCLLFLSTPGKLSNFLQASLLDEP